jgi:molybdopterin-containing oxidoreductase family iron-sulfur binding subunit
MVIDLDRCNGCSACVVACAAENNIPVAGEEEAAKGRAISWLRIERHLEGTWPDVRASFVPVLCQHCDEAPCVPVCPVSATYEQAEGLNAQVYARCIGVRFCATACPYTAREFNYTQPEWPASYRNLLNPDVLVRERGQIEKCTFCVQRIRRAKDAARDAQWPLNGGEIQPACAQSCPTQAIVFGDRDDPAARVAMLSRDPRAFRLLEELGAQPRVTYLRRRSRGEGEEPT